MSLHSGNLEKENLLNGHTASPTKHSLSREECLKQEHQQEMRKRPPTTPLTPSLATQNVLKKNRINENELTKKNLRAALMGSRNNSDSGEDKRTEPSNGNGDGNSNGNGSGLKPLKVIVVSDDEDEDYNDVDGSNSGTGGSSSYDKLLDNDQEDTYLNKKQQQKLRIKKGLSSSKTEKESGSRPGTSSSMEQFKQTIRSAKQGTILPDPKRPTTNTLGKEAVEKKTENDKIKVDNAEKDVKTKEEIVSFESLNDRIDFELYRVNTEIESLLKKKKLKENSQLIEFLRLERIFERQYRK